MNCKPGDLAYTVGLRLPENNGRIVSVVRLYVEGERLPGHATIYDTEREPAWVCDSLGTPLITSADGPQMRRVIADCCLRPIRPQAADARDETLTWLDVPTKQGEKA